MDLALPRRSTSRTFGAVLYALLARLELDLAWPNLPAFYCVLLRDPWRYKVKSRCITSSVRCRHRYRDDLLSFVIQSRDLRSVNLFDTVHCSSAYVHYTIYSNNGTSNHQHKSCLGNSTQLEQIILCESLHQAFLLTSLISSDFFAHFFPSSSLGRIVG